METRTKGIIALSIYTAFWFTIGFAIGKVL